MGEDPSSSTKRVHSQAGTTGPETGEESWPSAPIWYGTRKSNSTEGASLFVSPPGRRCAGSRGGSWVAAGSPLAVDEDARTIRVDLRGPRRLRFPLTLVREDALDPERTEEELTTFIRSHLEAHLES